ncbi:amidase signature domain-containing protein [Cercophora newfieldiana]|uniref:Amidase signature domain-containing protein n=1 Tax=Cercophora newfieldiana TaxID=92897 RepID=A0AA39XUY9_9PEZI|nr:amidase signature domain-containing protein [Cercophora newfieldiana]
MTRISEKRDGLSARRRAKKCPPTTYKKASFMSFWTGFGACYSYFHRLTMTRFTTILAASTAVWLALFGQGTCSPAKNAKIPSLIDATIDDLQKGLKSGLFTSVDLVTAYQARIAQVNPVLHAVNEVNPDALAIAAELDALRAKGKALGPLHGIPILIKDNIATADKMNNTAGSYALVGAKVPRDSTMAAKLREAGAIILGKANLSQWANYRSSNSSSGWSAYGGQVTGAYYPNEDPGGSSSGSGVGTSIGLALGALGTETSGSIISPAQKGNLVGIKPTVGLTSRYLVIPISSHQDTTGPMTRTVKDAAIILQAIAGVDKYDNYTSLIPNTGAIPNYVAALKKDALKGARIGIPYNALNPNASTVEMAAFWDAVKTMQKAGAVIVDSNFTVASPNNTNIVLGADFVSDLAAYLAELTYNPNNVHTLADVLNFTQTDPREAYPDRDTARWDAALALGYNNTDGRFWADYQKNLYEGGEGGLLGAIKRNSLDAVILPTSQAAGRAAIQGAPIITVPLGFYPVTWNVTTNARGLAQQAPNIPFGLSLLGDLFSEEKLIGLAYAFEQRTLVREKGPKPYLAPNVDLADFVDTK